MADEWNKQNPDRPINLTVTTGESSSLHLSLIHILDIYLRIFGDLGLDETVLISDNQT